MAGHSHWSQIKRQKGAADAKRGQLFSKFSKEITVAAAIGGGDPGFNPRLRTAVATAKASRMPIDRIERAIKKGIGELDDGGKIEEIVYEGYGANGIAFLIECATDNTNRTSSEVRTIFAKNNGNFASSGSVAWMFKRKASFLVQSDSEDAVMEATLDAGVEDVSDTGGDGIAVEGPMDQYDALEKTLAEAGIEVKESKLIFVPDTYTKIEDEKTANQVQNLIDKLNDHDDVQNVYTNADIPDDMLEKIQG